MAYSSVLLLIAVVVNSTILTAQASQQCVCEVVITDEMRFDVAGGKQTARHRFDCVGVSDSTPFRQIRLNLDSEDTLYLENEEAFHKGEWFLSFPCHYVSHSQLPRHRNESVKSLSKEEIKQVLISSRRLRSGMAETKIKNPRRLSNIGTQHCAIVIVEGKDVANPLSIQDADNYLYSVVNQQFQGCSNGAMELVKKDNTIRLKLPNNLATYNDDTISDALNAVVCNHYYGFPNCDITAKRGLDHILYSIPFGLSNDSSGSFWAFASTGDERRYSVYGGGKWWFDDGTSANCGFFIPGVIAHELGHNYRLGHAKDPREDGSDPYGDMTGFMGGGVEAKRCYNGYNYYVLGWHQTQTNEISLTAGQANMYNLKGINDLDTRGIVNINVGPYYITYNLKKGVNSGIDYDGNDTDYNNEVIIHKGKNIKFGQTTSSEYSDTSVVGNLARTGDVYTVAFNGDTLKVQLCSIDKSGFDGAWLSIGLNVMDCSANVGAVINPQRMHILTDGVTETGLSASKNEVLEFKMNLPVGADSVTCTSSGGSGDADLTMNFLSTPQIVYEPGVNACFSFQDTNEESCTSDQVEGTVAYVALDAYEAFTGVSLLCKSVGGTPVAPTPIFDTKKLTSGVSKLLSAGIDEKLEFTLDVGADVESVECVISGGTGDADLYTRWDSTVDFDNRSSNTCVPWKHGNEEVCSKSDLRTIGSILHVGLMGYRGFSGVSLKCTTLSGGSPDGTAVVLSNSGSWKTIEGEQAQGTTLQYKCKVPSRAVTDMVVKTRDKRGVLSYGNLNLYVAIDKDPDITKGTGYNDCVKTSSNNAEKCAGFDKAILNSAGEHFLHITVHAKKAFKGVQIRCNALF